MSRWTGSRHGSGRRPCGAPASCVPARASPRPSSRTDCPEESIRRRRCYVTARTDTTKRMAMSTRKGRVEFEDDNGKTVRYDRHANGGGLVSPEARVSAEATIARTAYVEAGATVGDRTRIDEWSWIDRDVSVGTDVVVGSHVHV